MTNQVNSVPETYIFPQNDEEQYDAKLRRSLREISVAINKKETGVYLQQELYTGGSFIPEQTPDGPTNFSYRPIFRSVIDFGALPNASAKSVAHNLSLGSNASFIKIYGAATQTSGTAFGMAFPLDGNPAASIVVDTTNVTITTTTNLSTYNAFVILEYIRSRS